MSTQDWQSSGMQWRALMNGLYFKTVGFKHTHPTLYSSCENLGKWLHQFKFHFFLILSGDINNTYLIELFQELFAMKCIKHLAQNLTHSRHLVNRQCFYCPNAIVTLVIACCVFSRTSEDRSCWSSNVRPKTYYSGPGHWPLASSGKKKIWLCKHLKSAHPLAEHHWPVIYWSQCGRSSHFLGYPEPLSSVHHEPPRCWRCSSENSAAKTPALMGSPSTIRPHLGSTAFRVPRLSHSGVPWSSVSQSRISNFSDTWKLALQPLLGVGVRGRRERLYMLWTALLWPCGSVLVK